MPRSADRPGRRPVDPSPADGEPRVMQAPCARRRVDRRTIGARIALLGAAERLFGTCGVEAVSMRQIVSAAGFSNPYAIQYHFGDKDGLVDAIIADRAALLERQRAGLVLGARRRGDLDDPHVLAEILYRPVAALRDEAGRHSYAAFLLSMQGHDEARHILGDGDGRGPCGRLAKRKYLSCASHVPGALLAERRLAAGTLVLASIVQSDRRARDRAVGEQLVDDVIDAAVSIILAPVRT